MKRIGLLSFAGAIIGVAMLTAGIACSGGDKKAQADITVAATDTATATSTKTRKTLVKALLPMRRR